MTRGRRGSLALRRRALPSPPPYRFTPALRNLSQNPISGTVFTLTADAAFRAINNGQQLVHDLRDLRANWKTAVRARSDSAVWRVMELLLRQPIINTKVLQHELGIESKHADRHMTVLKDAGIVSSFTAYQRGIHWKADDVLASLDDFARRSGRRANPTRLS